MVPCRVSALMREARLMSVSQPFMKNICSPLQRSLTMRWRKFSPESCLTSGMASLTCSSPLRPTSTWSGRGYKTRITLPQLPPFNTRVGLRPSSTKVFCMLPLVWSFGCRLPNSDCTFTVPSLDCYHQSLVYFSQPSRLWTKKWFVFQNQFYTSQPLDLEAKTLQDIEGWRKLKSKWFSYKLFFMSIPF